MGMLLLIFCRTQMRRRRLKIIFYLLYPLLQMPPFSCRDENRGTRRAGHGASRTTNLAGGAWLVDRLCLRGLLVGRWAGLDWRLLVRRGGDVVPHGLVWIDNVCMMPVEVTIRA